MDIIGVFSVGGTILPPRVSLGGIGRKISLILQENLLKMVLLVQIVNNYYKIDVLKYWIPNTTITGMVG